MPRFILNILLIFMLTVLCKAQTIDKAAAKKTLRGASAQSIKSSPAYAEILLQKTELESQLEDFLGDYTEDFPKIKELRFQLGLIQKEMDKLFAVNPNDAGKLTLALGKLIVRKIELETNLQNLKAQYKDDYPEVKKAKRKVEVFERAIREILP